MAKTGERKAQILQTLASMLEEPKAERVTTALLAARLDVSEAALYRHFASKAQMYEGLIEFIEQTLFSLVNRIQADEKDAMKQIEATLAAMLAFAQKNPGMTRVLTGDALVNEDDRLQIRVNQLVDRLEASLQAKRAPRRDCRAAARGLGRERLRDHPHRLRDRPLAPVRQERLQALPDGGVAAALARLLGLKRRAREAMAFPEIATERLRLVIAQPGLEEPLARFYRENFAGHLDRWSPPMPGDKLTAAYWDRQLPIFAARVRGRHLGAMGPARSRRRSSRGHRDRQLLADRARRVPLLRAGLPGRARPRGQGPDARGAHRFPRTTPSASCGCTASWPTTARRTCAAGGCSQRLGFVQEGYARDYLFIDGAWRDHILTSRTNPHYDVAWLRD